MFNNVIILGGDDGQGNDNQEIYGFNLQTNEINIIGKIDTCALYSGQNIQLDESIFVIYDDATIEFGTFRLKKEGSFGGHNGIKSIINSGDTVSGITEI